MANITAERTVKIFMLLVFWFHVVWICRKIGFRNN
jgi:hypothetical protein